MKHLTISLLSVFLLPVLVGAHCEIPCGIYGDEGRFALLLENATTIEKSMNEINKIVGRKREKQQPDRAVGRQQRASRRSDSRYRRTILPGAADHRTGRRGCRGSKSLY